MVGDLGGSKKISFSSLLTDWDPGSDKRGKESQALQAVNCGGGPGAQVS